jgi:hypothetical protein
MARSAEQGLYKARELMAGCVRDWRELIPCFYQIAPTINASKCVSFMMGRYQISHAPAPEKEITWLGDEIAESNIRCRARALPPHSPGMAKKHPFQADTDGPRPALHVAVERRRYPPRPWLWSILSGDETVASSERGFAGAEEAWEAAQRELGKRIAAFR